MLINRTQCVKQWYEEETISEAMEALLLAIEEEFQLSCSPAPESIATKTRMTHARQIFEGAAAKCLSARQT